MNAISLREITKTYGKKDTALDCISMDFPKGRISCLIGPSGCGKTTVLRLISGLEVPDKGTITLWGKVVTKGKVVSVPPHKRGVGYIFQNLALWPHMTVQQNVQFGLKVMGIKDYAKKASDFLKKFSIGHLINKYPQELSGGQQQLVAIARSLVTRPKILLMDEPFSNLDIGLKKKMRRHILSLKEDFHLTIVYVTHDLAEAMELGEYAVVLHNGKVLNSGDPKILLREPRLEEIFCSF